MVFYRKFCQNPQFGVVIRLCCLLLWFSQLAIGQTYQWKTVEIGGGGFVTGTVFHPTEPGLVYARTDVGGAYRLDTATNRWIALNDDIGGLNNEMQFLGVLSIGLDPNDANRVYLATGQYAGTETWKLPSRIYRSTDRGLTWSYVTPGFKMAGNGEGRGTGERMAVDPVNGNNLLVGTSGFGIWRSTDYGATWSQLTGFPHSTCNFVMYAPVTHANPGPNRRVYAAANTLTGTSFWRSDDNGTTWAEVPDHPGKVPGLEMMPLQGAFDAAGVFYMTWGDATGPGNYATDYGVWKLSTDGTAWTSILPPTGQGFFSGIGADPRVAGHVVVSTMLRWWPGDEVYRSTDGGVTWTAALRTGSRSVGNSPWSSAVGPHWISDIDIDPFDSNRAIFNTGFGLFQSRNLSASGTTRLWTFFNDGLEELVPLGLLSPTAGPPLISVVGDYTGFRHDDLNRSPMRGFHKPTSGSTSVISGAQLAPQVMVRQNSSSTHVTFDAAATWATFPTVPPPIVNGHNRVVPSADGARFVWCPPNSPAYFSNNNGASWSVASGSSALVNVAGTPTLALLAGGVGIPGTTNATAENARFNLPEAVALDAEGIRYVADTANHTIRRIIAGGAVNTLAGGAGISGSLDASGTNARFSSPSGLVVDAAKTVYVADTGNHTIRKVSAAGVVTTWAGSPGSSGADDGVGTTALLNTPRGLALDASGNLYVCDSGNHTIRKITPAGSVSTLAGSPGLSGTDDGVGLSARFSAPCGLVLDGVGAIYVADTGNHTIRRIESLTGEVTTVAGLAGTSGASDGSGSAARFSGPRAMTIDLAGNFHIADTGNHTIRKMTAAGVVTTAAGLAGSAGSVNGSGSAARFNSPCGIVATPDGGNFYVADTSNHVIRRGYHFNTLVPLADRVDGNRLYLWDGSTAKRLYTSNDGGASFTVAASGLNSAFSVFRTVPDHTGHIWVRAGSSGLYRSTNYGASFTKIASVVECHQFDFGKAKPGNTHPSIYIWGKVGTVIGYFRSDDIGATWSRINDNQHNFGYQNDLVADPRVYGRVYLATSGRGVVVGDIAEPATPASQETQAIYVDALEAGWSNASPPDTQLASANPVRRGTHAVYVPSGSGKGLAMTCPVRSLEGYAALAFWISGGEAAPPQLQVGASRGGIALEAAPIDIVPLVGWQRIVVPFTDLGIARITDLTGLRIESRASGGTTSGGFSIDDIELLGDADYGDGIVTASVTLGNLEQEYDGTQKSVTVITNPPGLPVIVTYNSSSTAPTQAGSYAVQAIVDDTAIQGASTGTLVVTKARASIQLDNLNPSADGSPKAPTVTTVPAGLSVSVLYNGSPEIPILAGTYAVTATINDTNYSGQTSSTLRILQQTMAPSGLTAWASNIAGKVSIAPSTPSSPLLNPNDTTDDFSTNTLQSHFAPITLLNLNDRIVLTGSVQLTSAGASGSNNWFRFGLYNNRGQAANVATDWLGYTGMGTSLYERTGSGLFSTGSGASQRTPDASPTPIGSASPSGNPAVEFEVTATRISSGVLVTHLLRRADTQQVLMNYSFTDTTPNNNGVITGNQGAPSVPPHVPTFTTAGFAFSRSYIGTGGAQAQFSNVRLAFTPGMTAQPQTIDFPVLVNRVVNEAAFPLQATASSGLPVVFSIVSGPAQITGNQLQITGVGDVTVRATQTGDTNFLPAPEVERSFRVTKIPALVTFTSLQATYDGMSKSVAVTTVPPSLAVSITYNGSFTLPTAAGQYTVVATVQDATYQGSATGVLEVAKAAQTIMFNSVADQIYGNPAVPLVATASSGLPVTFTVLQGPATLTGSSLALDGAGTVVVRASQAGDANRTAAPPVERTIQVAKAGAAITIDGLDVPYDGTAKAVLVSTDPPGLQVNVTYNGASVAPLAPGSYAVSAVVDDPDYTGSAAGTLVIGNRGFTQDLTGWIATTSSLSNAATSSPLWNPNNNGGGLAGKTHAFFSPIPLTTAGDTLKLTGTVAIQVRNNSRTQGNKSNWFRFGLFRNQSTVTLPSSPVTDWLGYCGMAGATGVLYERTGTADYTTTGTGATARIPQTSQPGVNSGTNSITLRFTETITRTSTGVDVNYLVTNTANNATVMSFTYSDTTPNNNGSLGGAQNTPAVPVYSPEFSAAGFAFDSTYISSSNAKAQFSNVQVSFSSPSPGAAQSITFAPLANRLYGDAAIVLNASASSGLPVSYTLVSGPAALNGNVLTILGVGEVVVRASQGGNINYLPASPIDRAFTVAKASAQVTLSQLSHAYDGSAKSAAVATNPPGLVTEVLYNGQQVAPYLPGQYEVSAVITDEHYSGSASSTMVIASVPQSINFNALVPRVFGESSFAISATASSGLPVQFSVLSGPAQVEENLITLTGAGTVVIRASQSGDTIHAPAMPVDQSFSVSKAIANVTLSGLSATYDGFAKSASASTNPVGLNVSMTYDGSATLPVNAGDYAVGATVVDANYSGAAVGVLSIIKASQSIDFTTLPDRVLTDTPFALLATATSGLPVQFSVLSGPASISNGMLTLSGSTGIVTVRASQSGDVNHFSASPVERSFAVNKVPATVILENLNATEDGTQKSVAVSTVPAGLSVNVLYNGLTELPIYAGSYAVSATIVDSTYTGMTNATLVIAPRVWQTPVVNILKPAANPVSLSELSSLLVLTATVDPGPNPGPVALGWSVVSGPASVVFGDVTAANTTASFSAAGTYVLRCTATHGSGPQASTGFAEVTVLANTGVSATFRQGENGYQQEATFLRADAGYTNVNSGARNQVIVGKTNGILRAVLSFDLSSIPSGSSVIDSTLDLTTHSELGVGMLQALELRSLAGGFTEGTGDGSTADTTSGANWTRRSNATENLLWNTGETGGAVLLSTVPGFNAATTPNTKLTFSSTTAFQSALHAAVGSPTRRLNMVLRSPGSEPSVSALFARFHSDDALTAESRPTLRVTYMPNPLPIVTTGSATPAIVGIAMPLNGSVDYVKNDQPGAQFCAWSVLSGPSGCVFSAPEQPVTSVTFALAGSYILRLQASNAAGLVTRELAVEVAPHPFTAWQVAQWPNESNPGIIGVDADPDNDGLANKLEFALGLEPDIQNATPASVTFHQNTSSMEFRYTRNPAAVSAGWVFQVEWSNSLSDNDWHTDSIGETIENPSAVLHDITALHVVPIGTPSRFLRLRVITPP